MIGMALTKALVSKGHHVYAVLRKTNVQLNELNLEGKISIIHSDMSEYSNISTKICDKIDVAILMAWNGTRGSDRDNVSMQMGNYHANISILPELVKLGCHKIISAGSQAEYGPWNLERKISEKDIPNPNTEYGKQKLAFYEFASEFSEKNEITMIEPRFFSLYGPDDFGGTLIMSMLDNMRENKPCLMTQCIQRWDYLYIDDAISALTKLILEDYPSGVYNFGSGESHNLKHYIEIMYQETGSKSELMYGAIPYPITGMVNVNPDVTKLIGIGWRPTISFEEGIRRILHKKNACEKKKS